jgi:hypothetical protein
MDEVAAVLPGPLVLDLIAALVQSGAPPPAALRAVGAALQAVGDSRGADLLSASARVSRPGSTAGAAFVVESMTKVVPAVGFWVGRPGSAGEAAAEGSAGRQAGPDRLTEVVEEALGLAARSGLPPTALIRRSATEERRRQAAAQMRAVRRLEVLLVVPAGLCLLPAFVLLGIVPVVLDLILG